MTGILGYSRQKNRYYLDIFDYLSPTTIPIEFSDINSWKLLNNTLVIYTSKGRYEFSLNVADVGQITAVMSTFEVFSAIGRTVEYAVENISSNYNH